MSWTLQVYPAMVLAFPSKCPKEILSKDDLQATGNSTKWVETGDNSPSHNHGSNGIWQCAIGQDGHF